jgi:hypothetical protein
VKRLLIAIFFVFSGLNPAFGSSYQCAVKANPDEGIPFSFTIVVAQTSFGDEIQMIADGDVKLAAPVTEATSLSKDNLEEAAAFSVSLGFVGSESVSGISGKNYNSISSMEIFRAELPGGDEILVYKIFDDRKQIGGSLLMSGMGAPCLPKK